MFAARSAGPAGIEKGGMDGSDEIRSPLHLTSQASSQLNQYKMKSKVGELASPRVLIEPRCGSRLRHKQDCHGNGSDRSKVFSADAWIVKCFLDISEKHLITQKTKDVRHCRDIAVKPGCVFH